MSDNQSLTNLSDQIYGVEIVVKNLVLTLCEENTEFRQRFIEKLNTAEPATMKDPDNLAGIRGLTRYNFLNDLKTCLDTLEGTE